jgi:hypothetical protein
MREPIKASAGIYYVIRLPAGWRLASHRFHDGQDVNHQQMWEDQTVPELARAWAPVLGVKAAQLEHDLAILAFAFPRGRIVKSKEDFAVFHGDDLKPSMAVGRKEIEAAFGIKGKCRWRLDDHERCITFEKEEIQRVLQLTEDWPSTEFWD